MTVLLDATTAQHTRGIRTVINGVISELPDGLEDILVVGGPDLIAPANARLRQISLARTRAGRLLYQRLLLPLDVAHQKTGGHHIDRVLLLDSYVPIVRPQRGVRYASLVHDVLPLTHPHFWPLAKRLVKRTAFASLRAARPTLFTSSEHNASLLHRLLGIDAQVVHFGCGQLCDSEAEDAVSTALPSRGDYLLYIGAFEPRKNLPTLLDAFEQAAPHIPAHRLVLVGGGSRSGIQALRQRIESSPLRDQIEIRSQLSRQATMLLLARAKVLLFPSLAEGFGLPVLEALALGAPVVASNIPEIRSWAGGVVYYSSPTNALEWVEQIVAAVDTSSQRRRAGQALASGYRWGACAQSLLAF